MFDRASSWFALTRRFAQRDLKNRFAGSFSGCLWALLQPLLQLAITSFVFIKVFKARIPEAEGLGYVPFLAIGLWPWFAFSEAILRSTTTIQDNAALIGKVAMPRAIFVVASVMTTLAIQLSGFVAVIVVLAVAGQGVIWSGLLPAILIYVPLSALALGFALICASLQVFVRDLVQVLGSLLPLLMFAAPVYYDRMQLPAQYRGLLAVNPYTYYAETFRALLLGHGAFDVARTAVAGGIAAGVLLAGVFVFRKLDPHFEDFL